MGPSAPSGRSAAEPESALRDSGVWSSMAPGAASMTVVAVVVSATGSGHTAVARATGTNRCAGGNAVGVPDWAGSIWRATPSPTSSRTTTTNRAPPGVRKVDAEIRGRFGRDSFGRDSLGRDSESLDGLGSRIICASSRPRR